MLHSNVCASRLFHIEQIQYERYLYLDRTSSVNIGLPHPEASNNATRANIETKATCNNLFVRRPFRKMDFHPQDERNPGTQRVVLNEITLAWNNFVMCRKPQIR